MIGGDDEEMSLQQCGHINNNGDTSSGSGVEAGSAMIPEVSILDRSWIVLVSIARIDP
jgi:hypothetical protein